jgi:hypothetical protein
MAMGIIIMGFGFFIYGFAAMQFGRIRIFKYDLVSYGVLVSYYWRTMYFSCRVVLHYEIISSKICLINDGSLFLLRLDRKQGSWYNRDPAASDLGEYSVFFGNISIYACSWFYICYVFEAITTPHSWS